ncbi:MAG: NAD-dependent deacylase, partial [Mycobacteriaceae bacterium]|nr:NAD-dependent deacylase [Mycobacteriaceae bacterium]
MRVTVLSGAGISAESGVPTFRDDKNGLWAQFDPYELSSVQGWLKNPERVWAWYLWRYYLVGQVQPNAGHHAIAAWQADADVCVVTQNVDDLHERAGSTLVHHVHGSIFEFRCATCDIPYTGILPKMAEPEAEVEPPTCSCGGLIRPDIVWFGEALPDHTWQHSVEATVAADVLVVVGTSGIVYPAAGLADLALAHGAAVIEVNPEPTPLT